ncbi:hypothetical protein C9374_005561 [Naegleria lovaniensis]|uniref:BTB domain-containing protein n=1 Tax=Naegleria lovaniensis TaxID=51637 RepID=A0AA88GNL3_NAELO|nr:uncharacterized protein C9374_005561 [Naegleria lovaniensis]KAG2382359.1 hypothetical protein C9374_005561 [Naegleria lovaniensis]
MNSPFQHDIVDLLSNPPPTTHDQTKANGLLQAFDHEVIFNCKHFQNDVVYSNYEFYMQSLKSATLLLLPSNPVDSSHKLLHLDLTGKINDATIHNLKVNANLAKFNTSGELVVLQAPYPTKAMQVFNIVQKTKVLNIDDHEIVFIDWLSNDTIGYVKDGSVHVQKLDQTTEPEKVFSVAEDFLSGVSPHKGIIKLEHDAHDDFFAILGRTDGGDQIAKIYSKKRNISRTIRSSVGGFTFVTLKDDNSSTDSVKSYIVITTGNNILFSDPADRQRVHLETEEPTAQLSVHFLKKYKLVIILSTNGTCYIYDAKRKTQIIHEIIYDKSQQQVENSFVVDEEYLIIHDTMGEIVKYSVKPDFMYNYYLKLADAEMIHLWKTELSKKGITHVLLSECVSPLSRPLKKYNRDLKGSIHVFSPLISHYFPNFYEKVILRNAELSSSEVQVVEQLISYMIYGGDDVKINTESILEWSFIAQQCGEEFSKLKNMLKLLFLKTIHESVDPFQLVTQIEGLISKHRNDNEDNNILNYSIVNEQAKSVTMSLKFLMNDTNSSDITVEAFGKGYHLHRTVISSVSEFFQIMMDEEGAFNESKNNVLSLLDHESMSKRDTEIMNEEDKRESFEILLEFTYSSFEERAPSFSRPMDDIFELLFPKPSIDSHTNLRQFIIAYDMADLYQFNSHIRSKVVTMIEQNLTVETFLQVVEWSKSFAEEEGNENELQNCLIDFASRHIKNILAHYSNEKLGEHGELLAKILRKLFVR